MKQVGIWAGITVIFFVTTWGLIALVNSKNSIVPAQTITPPSISKDDQVLGVSDKVKAVLIGYADFQCQACKDYALIIKQLKKDFSDDLLIVYRFFPLPNHQNSMLSSQAAYAAGKQNKFWEMSDMLYENQENWANSSSVQDIFIGYAKKINLDIAQFVSDYNAETTKKFIIDSLSSGISIGINYTPTFFVNGKRIDNPQGYAAFKKLIQNEINQK